MFVVINFLLLLFWFVVVFIPVGVFDGDSPAGPFSRHCPYYFIYNYPMIITTTNTTKLFKFVCNCVTH